MPATTFDLDTPIGRMHVYLYEKGGDLMASFQDELSRHPNFASNPPEGITPVTVNRIPVTVSYNLQAAALADLTTHESWRFGYCSATRLDVGSRYADVTPNQRRTIWHTILDAITGLFVQYEDLVFAVIASSQAAIVAELRKGIARAEEGLAALRERSAAEDTRLNDMQMMIEPAQVITDRTAFQVERAKVFGLRAGN